MNKLKRTASIILAAALLTSSSALYFPASAVEKADTTTSQSSNLQSNVQDGVILHAFNWSYSAIKQNLPAIAAAGYSTIQTSPVQQPKDFCASTDVTGQWWKLYQPVSFSVAEESWLGTKAELTELCKEAGKYGIKIICDIVSNHMGNETDDNPNSVSSQVEKYEPEIYKNQSTYFRNSTFNVSDSSIKNVVQGHLTACPELATNTTAVQNKVIGLLKECIDCGVDGFRFDAAKHIETEDDGEYASDYWKNVTTSANTYYNQKTGDNLYIYGEILNNCGASRKYSSYTKYINVTDNRTGDSVLANVTNGKASSAASATYKSGVDASDLVVWAESHDTFEGDSGSGGISNTSSISDENVVKAWAIVAARKDATSLYFARPGDAKMGEASTNTTYKSVAVSEVNKFHNLFVGQSEKLGSSGDVAYVVRGTSGIVLANCKGTNTNVSITGTGLANGTYTDTVTGNKFTVSNGTLSGSIGATGVAVVYNGSTTPRNTCSVESSTFSDSIDVKIGLSNATSGTYCIDGIEPVAFSGNTLINIGSDYAVGETVNLTLTATDGKNTTTTTYSYVKENSASSGVYAVFSPTLRETKAAWVAPYYAYVYDEDTNSDMTYTMSAWPGLQMKLDETTGYYYVEISSISCIGTDKSGKASTVNFDLAHSANTKVIISDSANVNSSSHQYPTSGAHASLKINGSSKLFGNKTTTSWEDTTFKPTKKSSNAILVTRGAQLYGDANSDGTISIEDVTTLQLCFAEYNPLSSTQKLLCDLNEDGMVDIQDATIIQLYLASYPTTSKVGTPYIPEVAPTQPTQPTTQPTTPTQPTEPEPTPATYTLYFKTQLPWMVSSGAQLYVYDNATTESYLLSREDDEYPNVYSAKVPNDVSSVTFYRAAEAVDKVTTASDNGPVYNLWTASVSSTNNCFTLDNDATTFTVAPFVHEEAPEWTLETVYFDNSQTKWSSVYIYGWGGGMSNQAYEMTQISGTDIWYFEMIEPLYPNEKCFLFKNTKSTWDKQTKDVTVQEGKNLYNGKTGAWSVYEQ